VCRWTMPAVLMTQVNCPSCFSLRFMALGSTGKMPMSPPRFFGFSRLELCLKVGSLGFRGTTNLHRQEEGHLFEWGALQTIKSCQQGSGHSKIHRITAGGSAALGRSKIRVAVLCLQSLVGSAHRVKGSEVSPSPVNPAVNRIGPSIFILLSTTTLSISSPQEANGVCSLLQSTWLLIEVFFHAQFVCQFLTQLAGGRG
jgi:hypothetical protein